MANTAQARKRARQAVKQNEHNSSLRSKLRTSIKAVRKAIETGDKAAATKRLLTKILLLVRSHVCPQLSRRWQRNTVLVLGWSK
jgi:ribosomal protein S20